MKISCPTCSAKYSVADEKIQSRLAKIRCRKCSSTIVIDGTASPAKVYVGDASSAISASGPPHDMEAAPGSGRGGSAPAPGMSDPVGPAPDEYAVDIADNDQRNMTIHQIVGAYNEGMVTADTYIWKEGMPDWQTLAEVKEVADALHAAARPAAAQPAAVRRSNHNSSADLFGRIHTAGGEDDITTSAPEPSPALTAGTGARNESSVLFSLSALTGGAAPAAPVAAPSNAPKKRSDDSGLIDLQALTASEGGGNAGGFAAAPNAFGASPLISAPLGGVSGPALGGSGRSSGGRWGLIAAALVLAGCLIGGTLLLFKGGGNEADQPTSAAEHRPAAAPEPSAAQPSKQPEPSAAPSEPEKTDKDPAGTTRPVAAEELPVAGDPAKPSAPKPAAARPVRPAAPKPVASSPTAPAAEPEATPKPAPAAPKPAPAAVDPKKPRCDCKPADLLCAMKCSAKKP
ncbi:MAG: hypothetical protein RL033_6158 [Pseudomonadota bacterium]